MEGSDENPVHYCHNCKKFVTARECEDEELFCDICEESGYVQKVEDSEEERELREEEAEAERQRSGGGGEGGDSGNGGDGGGGVGLRGQNFRRGAYHVPFGTSGSFEVNFVPSAGDSFPIFMAQHGEGQMFGGVRNMGQGFQRHFDLSSFEDLFNHFDVLNDGDYVFGDGGFAAVIQQLTQNDPNNFGNPPAAKDAVRALPEIKVTEAVLARSGGCAVCKDSFELEQTVIQMPCSHVFCTDCLKPWLERHNTCPTCRFELRTDDPDYEQRRAASLATMDSQNTVVRTAGSNTATHNVESNPQS